MTQRNGIIAILILVGVCLACDGMSRIGGQVVDANGGEPIQNASVLFEAVEKGEPAESYQCRQSTRPDGKFSCGFVHAPWNIKLRLTIEKTGYHTYVRELSARELKNSPGGNMGSQIITLEQQ